MAKTSSKKTATKAGAPTTDAPETARETVLSDASPEGNELPYKTRIDLAEAQRQQLVALLNQTLANTSDLYSQTKQAHWNVKGRDFYQLHLLYDELAEKLEEPLDLVAERIVLLGGYAHGTVRMAAAGSGLSPWPGPDDADPSFLATLADRWAEYARHIREADEKADEIGDPATVNLYDEITNIADRGLWFIEGHMQRYAGGLAQGGADPV
ncbi:MAG TPA: DNA starvation/stationary phase protection protein Dps [Rubricoccaceae bacterium]|jgi:starvation-inducible DNA-binding protein